MSFLIFYQNERMGQRELTKIEGNFGVIFKNIQGDDECLNAYLHYNVKDTKLQTQTEFLHIVFFILSLHHASNLYHCSNYFGLMIE